AHAAQLHDQRVARLGAFNEERAGQRIGGDRTMLVLKVLSSGIEGLRDYHVAGADPRQHGVGVGASAVVRLWDELVSLGNEQDGERNRGPELHKHIARIISGAPLTILSIAFGVLLLV